MYTVSKIDSLEGFKALRPIWDDLVTDSEHPNIFRTFDWHRAWWETFGVDHDLYILTISANSGVIGIAPLMRTKGSFPGRHRRIIRFIGTPEADYCDFIGSDKAAIVLNAVEYLLQSRKDWTEIEFSQISERSPTVGHLRDLLRTKPINWYVDDVDTCPSFVFEGDEKARSEYRPRRSKSLRNCLNYFRNSGTLTLEDYRDTATIEKHLSHFCHCHITRWGKTPTPSRFLESRYRDFYRSLARWLSPGARISMLVLKYQERPVAYQFNFVQGRTVFIYTLAHDVFYNRKSPGKIMNILAVQHYVRQGYVELDYIRGGEGYKDSVANRRFSNYRFRIYRRHLDHTISAGYRRLKRTALVRSIVRDRRIMKCRTIVHGLYRTLGVIGLVRHMIRTALRAVWHVTTVDVLSVKSRPDLPINVRLDVEPRRLDKLHIAEIVSLLGSEMDSPSHQSVQENFEKGSVCFAGYHNDQMVAVGWKLDRRDAFQGRGFSPIPAGNQVVFTDLFTSPVFRGLNIMPYLLKREVDSCCMKGQEYLMAVSRTDAAALQMAQKLGFTRIYSIRHLSVCGHRVSGAGRS